VSQNSKLGMKERRLSRDNKSNSSSIATLHSNNQSKNGANLITKLNSNPLRRIFSQERLSSAVSG